MIQAFFQSYGLPLLLGLGLSLMLVRFSVLFAKPLGLLDHPGGRKNHAIPTPVTGGPGVFFALLPDTFRGTGNRGRHHDLLRRNASLRII